MAPFVFNIYYIAYLKSPGESFHDSNEIAYPMEFC